MSCALAHPRSSSMVMVLQWRICKELCRGTQLYLRRATVADHKLPPGERKRARYYLLRQQEELKHEGNNTNGARPNPFGGKPFDRGAVWVPDYGVHHGDEGEEEERWGHDGYHRMEAEEGDSEGDWDEPEYTDSHPQSGRRQRQRRRRSDSARLQRRPSRHNRECLHVSPSAPSFPPFFACVHVWSTFFLCASL